MRGLGSCMAPPSLTCQELVELVTDYLEDALPAADRERFEAHLDGCPGCRAYLSQVRATLEAMSALREFGGWAGERTG
jgi:anti-sigma factor RsiW